MAGSTFALTKDIDDDDDLLHSTEDKARDRNEAVLFRSMYQDCSKEEFAAFRKHLRENNNSNNIVTTHPISSEQQEQDLPLTQAGFRVDSRRTKRLEELMEWQQYTVSRLLQNKTGPKKTLPVVVVKYEGRRCYCCWISSYCALYINHCLIIHYDESIIHQGEVVASDSPLIRPNGGAVEL